jgi:hypothetical protein
MGKQSNFWYVTKTPGPNLTHSTNYNLGFIRGVSLPLTSNAFRFWLWYVFQVKGCARRKECLQKAEGLLQTGARADAGKGAVICGVTSQSTDYVKT